MPLVSNDHFAGGANLTGAQTDDLASVLNTKVGNDKAELVAVDAIVDPATATTEDVATKVNELIAALKA